MLGTSARPVEALEQVPTVSPWKDTLHSTFTSPLTYEDRVVFPAQPANYQASPQIPLGPVHLLKPTVLLQVTMSANGQSKGVIGSMATSAADRRRVRALRSASRIAIII